METSFPLRRDDLRYRLFLGEIKYVDYERMALVILDVGSGFVHNEVLVFPAIQSSKETTHVSMPEVGTQCLCCVLEDQGGYQKIGVVSYVLSSTFAAVQGLAYKGPDGVEGMDRRYRGLYRKAYPGETTNWSPLGFSERIGAGWDHQAMDLSRDTLDPFKRTRTTLQGGRVDKTDHSVTKEGPVVRPGSPDVFPVLTPDGTAESILHLRQTFKPKSDPRARYLKGDPDQIPLTESVERVMEFALDFPITKELLDNEEQLETLLGLTLDASKWWGRTGLKKVGDISCDDQTHMIEQGVDHPKVASDPDVRGIGPTQGEGPTPRRRGWIIEKSEGTLVGFNKFDSSTYGKVLKPTIFPNTPKGRFSVDTESGYLPTTPMEDHSEVRLAASAMSLRFPYEYNTTRMDITKEGMLSFEIGSTLPKENILWDKGKYEHPHGAGRSIEGATTGSVKLVFGKNRDEEESLDLATTGGALLRLGADDGSLPDSRRSTLTQIRGKKDVVAKRELQWWKKAKLTPGDAGDLEEKRGAENVSLRAAMDGGMFLRLGARHAESKRRHLINGYQDGPGRLPWSPSDPSRKDSRSNGRPTYGAGDPVYRFHDLSKVTEGKLQIGPYASSGDPTGGSADTMGRSADIHAVSDVFLRAGAHEKSGQSVTLDLAGGILAAIGKDKQGRSISADLDGGIEMTVGQNNQKKGIRLEINGDVDIVIRGHLNLNVTGDIVGECASSVTLAKLNHVIRGNKVMQKALTCHVKESPTMIANQGNYSSPE